MDVSISVAPDHDSKTVVSALEGRGLKVEQVLFKGRIVIGSCDPTVLPALREVPGVKSLEAGREVRAQEEA